MVNKWRVKKMTKTTELMVMMTMTMMVAKGFLPSSIDFTLCASLITYNVLNTFRVSFFLCLSSYTKKPLEWELSCIQVELKVEWCSIHDDDNDDVDDDTRHCHWGSLFHHHNHHHAATLQLRNCMAKSKGIKNGFPIEISPSRGSLFHHHHHHHNIHFHFSPHNIGFSTWRHSSPKVPLKTRTSKANM